MNSFLTKLQRRDADILMIFNNSIKCKPLDILMPLMTYFGSFIFSTLFCFGSVFSGNTIIRQFGIKTSIALILSSFIARITKITVNRIRPYILLENLNIRKIGIDNYSFPSGHTTAAFCIAVMIAITVPCFAILAIIIATMVGISRMYLGVHFPSDVLAGIILGCLTSLTIYNLL